MDLPLSTLIFDARVSKSPEQRVWRDIENHYHLGMIAENSDQLVRFQAESLGLQAKTAAMNLRAMGELAQRQDETNEHLSALVEGMGALRDGMDRMNEGINALNETATATLDAVYEQTSVLREGFAMVASRLIAQHKTLLDIAKTLRRPYEAQMLELRQQADKWLTSGMRNTGKARDDDFDDATKLLQEVIKNPIGNQDYVTWFQIGWLLWKHEKKLGDAEQAFYRASRLSAPQANQYHVLSVRHVAYMQYLQGRHEEAYQSVQKVVGAAVDHDAPFDAARYAAKTGRKEEALRLLERCIELQPTTIITMFAEQDFQA